MTPKSTARTEYEATTPINGVSVVAHASTTPFGIEAERYSDV